MVELESFRLLSFASESSRVRYPRPGWAEVDAEELWRQIAELARRAVDELADPRVDAVGFTAYLASPVPVDEDGRPLYPIMLWLDTRAAGLPREVWSGFPKVAGYNALRLLEMLRITGGAPGRTGKDPLSKIVWLRENEPDVYRSARYILDARGFLVMKATGAATASPDEAGLTWMADTRTLPPRWHLGLAGKYGVDPSKLPPISDPASVAGRLTAEAAAELG
ncbi:MAG: FGGY family carbohydrate kinase, partial [Thermoproteota archaeon]